MMTVIKGSKERRKELAELLVCDHNKVVMQTPEFDLCMECGAVRLKGAKDWSLPFRLQRLMKMEKLV